MRLLTTLLTICATGAAFAAPDSLDGQKILLRSGATKRIHPPVSLPYAGPAPEDVILVRQNATGKEFLGTVREGELVFVPEGALPDQELTYTVEIEPRAADAEYRVELKKQEGVEAIDVFLRGHLFTTYHYSNDNKKPFLSPVNSEGEVGVTREFPVPEDTPEFGKDHPHHKSLYTAYGEVNGVDCWAEGENSGYQRSGEVTFGSGDAYGWIKAKNTWVDKEDKPQVAEEREYRFYNTPAEGRLVDVFVTFRADYGDANFTDTKEGGIVAVRMRHELSYANGVISNALGDVGEETTWGKPSPWCDYSGELPGIGVRGLTVFDHPSNLRYPTSWHVRKYGLMGANCFGYSYFAEKDYNKGLLPTENGDYLIKSGESLSFKHRVYVHSGDVAKAAVADRYADFAAPPEATWVE